MDTIGEKKLWSFLANHAEARETNNSEVRRCEAYLVNSYFELATKVAELQFRNPSYVLLFRGQHRDYQQTGLTTLRPTLFRSSDDKSAKAQFASLDRRFRRLKMAEERLSSEFRPEVARLGSNFVERYRVVRWSILQHYEVCHTPLLDVTHSLRISCSFASIGAKNGEAYLFVLAVPHISGAVSVCAEEGIQTVRLVSVTPPSAIRPHLQEGYLLGEYPELDTLNQKSQYVVEEVDFGNRLVAKFRFDPALFWDRHDFPVVSKAALYPEQDPVLSLTESIKQQVRQAIPPLS